MKVLIGRDVVPRRRFTVRWVFEPRDVWIGVFWNTVTETRVPELGSGFLLVYVCVVPCFPLVFAWRT